MIGVMVSAYHLSRVGDSVGASVVASSSSLKCPTMSRRRAVRHFGVGAVLLAVAPSIMVSCRHESDSDDAPLEAFVDFTTKPDGAPPSHLDTGEPVDYVQDAWTPPRMPRVEHGELVHGDLPPSGSYACYYQARLRGDCHAFGASWTVDEDDGSSTSGVMCIAAWAGIYESGTGMTVPKTPGHIVIDTISGEWQWWVSDGEGKGAEHLQVVKAGACSLPASDGSTVWEIGVSLDDQRGIGHLYLPGVDRDTGSRNVSLTDAEIADALRSANLPVTTLRATRSGSNVVQIEHYSNNDARTARYPRFRTLWAKFDPPLPRG